jgi:colicin import membrane protein
MKDLGFPISVGLHALVLAAAIFTLPGAEPLAPAEESLPVEIITPEQFTALTKGEKTAKPADKPQARVDKVAEAKLAEDDPAELVKRESVSTPPPPQPKLPDPVPEPPKPAAKAEPTPEPPRPEPPKRPEPPEPAKAEAKPEPAKPEPAKPEPKPEPKPVPKEEAQKLDELALKALQEDKPKEEAKKEPDKSKAEPPKPSKTAEASEKATSAKAAQPQETPRKFDASKVAALLSKEAPARAVRSDSQTSNTASLGSTRGNAPRLTLSQRSAIVGAILNHVSPCWNKPGFAADPSSLSVLINVNLNQDGTLSAEPEVVKYPAGSGGAAAAGAAMRAIKRCVTTETPLKLPPNLYASWKEIEVNFAPSS